MMTACYSKLTGSKCYKTWGFHWQISPQLAVHQVNDSTVKVSNLIFIEFSHHKIVVLFTLLKW